MVKKINALLHLPDPTASKPLAWPALYAILMAVSMANYMPYGQANFWLGIIAIVIFIRFPQAQKSSYRFLWIALASMGLYLVLPVQTLLFLSLTSMLLFSIEAIAGKMNVAVLPVVFLMSPVANYAAEVFSFPIRLQLTQWSVKLLQLTGNDALAHGNTISFNGAMFEVDHACMGLSMLVSSLLMALIGLQLAESKYNRRLPFVYVPLVLLYFMAANVAANLIRIICLVYFQIAPGTFMHDTVGILCWMVYGIIPCLWLVKAMVTNLGNYEYVKPITSFHLPQLSFYSIIQISMLGLLTWMVGFKPAEKFEQDTSAQKEFVGAGYTQTKLDHGVVQYKNEQELIYVKSIRGFYSTDHNPSICWRGSGYSFTNVRNTNRAQADMYMARLVKGESTLYTAWWYEHKNHRTNNQIIWRMKNLKHGWDYRLVNITAASQVDLEKGIEKWMGR